MSELLLPGVRWAIDQGYIGREYADAALRAADETPALRQFVDELIDILEEEGKNREWIADLRQRAATL